MYTSGTLPLRALAGAGVIAILLAAGCASEAADPGSEVIVIAADLELSGDGSELGDVYRNALELRVDQLNRQGHLGGRRLELVVRDNRTDPATSAANIAEFVADDSVTAIVTGGCAACLMASIETVNAAGVPTIALAGSDELVNPVNERPYVFKVGPNPADSATFLAGELSRAGAETVAVVASNDDYGSDGLEEMSGALARVGIELTREARISQDDESIQAAAEAIAQSEPEGGIGFPATPEVSATSPDAVVIWANSGLTESFAVRLRNAGYEGALFLDMAAASNLFLTGPVAAALDGATMVFTETLVIDEVVATSPAKTARKSWFNDYSARYGTYHAFASFAADAVQLVAQAVTQIDSTDREAVRSTIERSQLDGFTGPLRITPDNHSALTPLAHALLILRGDRWRLAN